MVLAGFEPADTPITIDQLALKIKNLRIFEDTAGKMNLAGADAGGKFLLTSQFTLFADCKYGSRPSFDKAAKRDQAKDLYAHFVAAFERIAGTENVVHTPFGSDLDLELVNHGPVTLLLDSRDVL